MFHTGSRGFGYQICDDYLKKMRNKRLFELPDPQLSSVYIGDHLGARYISAMKAAANYAWANRQIITHLIRESFQSLFHASYRNLGMNVLYDVSHNIARFEQHFVDSKELMVCVHRKGATRAFPEGSPDIPQDFKNVGQPVLIPGDMGRSSYILKGEPDSMLKSFGTTCHGAGKKGILVLSKSTRTLKEEMPDAYKNVTQIVDIVEENGLASKVVKLKPLGVIKG
ncbi:RNA-splicing ligase RtcB [subsurface metagenome]